MMDCAYPNCKAEGKIQIQEWKCALCDKHHEAWRDLSLMSMKNASDYRKMIEAQLRFSIACGNAGAKRELSSLQKGRHPRLRSLTAADFVADSPHDEDCLEDIQKTLNDLGMKIKVWPTISAEDKKDAKEGKKSIPDEKYKRIKCQHCGNMIPSNGAAQFSHLKKHVKELLSAGKLTDEQVKEIRSIRLKPEHEQIFAAHFNS